MAQRNVQIGGTDYIQSTKKTYGEYINLNGEKYYKIDAYDKMRPFFISLVSHSNLWMFISSTGGLSAGRKNENSALFPYYTDDKITKDYNITGSNTIIKVILDDRCILWEPFSELHQNIYHVDRNIYKNSLGNKIVFEERNKDLKASFRYAWQFSDKYGFVRQSWVINEANEEINIEILDGIQNLLPYGITSQLQNERSNLANAYKKAELEIDSGLGLFLLSSRIVDRAEPSEALKTTTVWSAGIKPKSILLSGRQLDNFRADDLVIQEEDIRAESGSYFNIADLKIHGGSDSTWYTVAEVNQGHQAVIELHQKLINDKENLISDLVADIEKGGAELMKMVGMADGLQLTGNTSATARHFSNVLFNIMRGGVFDDQYWVEKPDLKDYIFVFNKKIYNKHLRFIDALPRKIDYGTLIMHAESTKDPDLLRICLEYLPLTFSRRHGDPSRPWNKFSIETKKEDGSKNRNYEGNWRDIFQNWEALALAFPGYIESMISKFLNASTIDGYNPYRITRSGIDWEEIDPDDPWSFIGYWGDHQIIYLLKLLEISFQHNEENLIDFLDSPIFVYANVPYIIKLYDDILNNPKDTILFDEEKNKSVQDLVDQIGSDGKLVYDDQDQLIRANLTEKLLVTFLAKMSNFIPEAGIWMNTQRPEWNDANNALVGNGVSMVTLYYLRRFIAFCYGLFLKSQKKAFMVHEAIAEMMIEILGHLDKEKGILESNISDEKRKSLMDSLGKSAEKYRKKAYKPFPNQMVEIKIEEILSLFELSNSYIDQSIQSNKRHDGLYHAYNLVHIQKNKASIHHLYEMLEGQTAVLSSGLLNPAESLEVLEALQKSKMYRKDQNSYMLYPDRQLPRFLDKNLIPESFVASSKLAQYLLSFNDTSIIVKNVLGGYHFNGNFTNAEELKKSLLKLDNQDLVAEELDDFMNVYEQIFKHRYFTGRSGTFYGYEGLGSIYWHMVSKLLLAVQENIYQVENNQSQNQLLMDKLIEHYYQIRAGIGMDKSPVQYGAIPTDPYSHTPINKGAQQPGMTGQVKEDIINRWAELGIFVKNGCIQFNPLFLRKEEFLSDKEVFEYISIDNGLEKIEVNKGELCFTYCQVPVIYRAGNKAQISVEKYDSTILEIEDNQLPVILSKEVFHRTGKIKLIRVSIVL